MARSLEDLGCPPGKVRIVKIGIDLEQLPFRPRPRAQPLIILQIARFVEKKGVDLSIRAYAAARPEIGSSELWLIGDGALASDLRSLSESLGVSSSTRFFGMLSHAECQQLIDRAHVCIQPSRTASNGDTEGGAPTVLIEMQAAGIPVVATKHADIPAVVAEPDALVDEEDVAGLAQELTRLARLPEGEWSSLVLKGRRLVEREHDARRVAERICQFYSEALGEVVRTK
jgi:colanic acid/amylovoran biosynthesis glycosyltransferase